MKCLMIYVVPHLSLFSRDWASSSGLVVIGVRAMSWIRFSLASRAKMRGPNLSGSAAPVGREGTPGDSLSRATLRFLLCASRVKKQEGHISQAGNESQCPRLQVSQRGPVMPGLHRQVPVCLSQTSGSVPSVSHWHAVVDEISTVKYRND